MKKELFAITESNRFIADEFARVTGKTKVSFFNECIHCHFQPKMEKIKTEYERLIYLYDSQLKQTTQGQNENKEVHIDQFELKKALGRVINYCLRHHISDCGPFKSIIYNHYQNNERNTSWENEQDKMILNDIEDAYTMVNQKMRYYGDYNPLAVLMEIFSNWELFWDDNRSYNLLADIIYCENMIEPITLYDVLYLLYKVDRIILNQILDKKM